MLYDSHLHSSFSKDSETLPEKQIEKAIELGLPGIIFTDHMDMDIDLYGLDFCLDLENYFPYMNKMKEKYCSDDFDIGIGIELGQLPHLAHRNKKLIDDYPFDFVIGSTHICNGKDPYLDSYFTERPIREAYLEYFNCVLNNVRACREFDSLGHLDYVVRYGKRIYGEEGAYLYRDYKDFIDEILSILIRNDLALEVNTGAYRNSIPNPNPNPSFEILKRYYEMGGRLITIGADAHVPEHVGLKFDILPEELGKIGFKSYFVYKNRKPIELPLQ